MSDNPLDFGPPDPPAIQRKGIPQPTQVRAIQTEYRGYRFRSRLEARWAVFFDALGVRFEYEVEGYVLPSGRYLVDFYLPETYDRYGTKGVWMEIKGKPPTEHENQLCSELCALTQRSVIMLVGPPSLDEDGDGGYQWNYDAHISDVGMWDNNMALHICASCRTTKFEFRNDYFQCPACKKRTCDYFNALIDAAVGRARRARFEFGEAPA